MTTASHASSRSTRLLASAVPISSLCSGMGRRATVALMLLASVMALAKTATAQVAANLTTIHQFTAPNPGAGLVLGADNNFYGTTEGGGNGGFGSIYQLASDGTATTIYSFKGTDGATPMAALVLGTDGSLYGTTYYGGANNYGTVFKVSSAGVFTSLYSFNDTDGAYPAAPLIQATDGNFYGVTAGGGKGTTGTDGTIFKITPGGTLTTLFSFDNYGSNSGATPTGALVQGSDGNFYGTARTGGVNGYGTVYQYTQAGAFMVLHSFDYTDGYQPESALVQGNDGNYFGTTNSGGSNSAGTAFEITPDGSILNTLYNFGSTNSDGTSPVAGLLLGNDGYFYGTTSSGGANGNGTVFQMDPSGSLVILQNFAGTDGANPQSALILGPDGYFYGTTLDSTVSGVGTVYRIDFAGDFSVFHTFSNSDGFDPIAGGLVQGSDGNFYGTTSIGGDYGNGTVFRVTSAGASTIYSFNDAVNADGQMPQTGLTLGSDGYFYGTTYEGGTSNQGTVFRITTGGVLTTLYDFSGANGNGVNPQSRLIQGADGNFYGCTSGGGANGDGTLYQLPPSGTPTAIYSFTDTDGGPIGGVVQGSDSNFYGVSANGVNFEGEVYRITPAGVLTDLHDFDGTDGAYPGSALSAGSDGNFYGTTTQGGTNSYGTVYRISSGGAFASLYSFAGGSDGYYPVAPPYQATDGYLYGTTTRGGDNNGGAIYRINSTGTLVTVFGLNVTDGYDAEAPLVQGSDGLFYGTTRDGGYNANATSFRDGTVFRFSLVPTLTSAKAVSATLTKAFSYQVTATNSPTFYAASGLPNGLSINASTGLISGTATTLGVYPVSLTLTNAYGNSPATVTITVVDQVPAITSALSPTIQLGVAFTYQITATHNPTSFSATNLPPGLSVDPATGIISGTPTTAGNYSTVIKAINSGGTGSAVLSLSVKAPPPVISGNLSVSGQAGVAFSYQITASNNPTTYSATGLPSGLTVSSTTGLISGTPTAMGTSSVTIKASNNGGTATATLTITIASATPVITSGLNQSAQVGSAFSYRITASNSPTSYGASGLPSGLSVNTGTGAITGTPTASGTYSVTISATNDGGTGSATLTITVAVAAPVINSSLNVTGQVGTAFSYQIAASNSPTGYGASGLPSGLSVNASTGVISGTPTVAGNSSATITASNAGGTASAVLNLTINPATPVVTSSLSVTGQVGVAFSYQITASNSPTSYAATGLPAGLSVNTSTGVISGTPTATGTASVTLSATNAGGTGTATLTITINPATPAITSALSATGHVGTAFSYQITASNSPTSYGASGLPSGLSVNASTGVISGTPTATGTSNVTLSATNAGGTASATLTITINPAIPAITSNTTATAQVGMAFSYQITASNSPTSYSAIGLPTGLSVNANTGVITGTPTAAGSYSVALGATNAGGTGSATLMLTVNPATPAITSSLGATGQVGAAFSYQIAATNSPTSYAATGLPSGLSINTNTGAITGTPTAAGTSSVTISATNAGGTGSATLTLTINPATPVVTSNTTATAQVGVAFSYQIAASNSPTSFAATGLPAGLSINTGTGAISGTPTATGTSSVTLSATNAGGTGTATLTLTVNPATPAITSALSATGHVGAAFSYQITASNSPTSFAATGLPSGLSVNTNTGKITGTPTATGTSSVTISATNAGGTGSATLTLTVKVAVPAITSGLSATGQVGAAFSYQIAASNSPTSYAATGLPAGLSINASTGTITGTPTAAGTSSVTISATNAGGTGSATLKITIKPATPVITSSLSATGQVGVAFSYQIAASNSPTSFAATGLPAGLSVNTATGAITGTPTAAGTPSVTISATNAGGTGTATLKLTIKVGVPVVTSAMTATAQVGKAFSYQIKATNTPTSYGVGGIRPGLSVDAKTGLITGTPTGAGTFTLTLRAVNSAGTGSASLTLTIKPSAPSITSPDTATATVGKAFSYQIKATGSPTSYGAGGLFAGVTIDKATGLISGTPKTAGTHTLTLQAANAGGTGTKTLTVTVAAK